MNIENKLCRQLEEYIGKNNSICISKPYPSLLDFILNLVVYFIKYSSTRKFEILCPNIKNCTQLYSVFKEAVSIMNDIKRYFIYKNINDLHVYIVEDARNRGNNPYDATLKITLSKTNEQTLDLIFIRTNKLKEYLLNATLSSSNNLNKAIIVYGKRTLVITLCSLIKYLPGQYYSCRNKEYIVFKKPVVRLEKALEIVYTYDSRYFREILEALK